jgi:ribosomal protein L11 methylase PrmA
LLERSADKLAGSVAAGGYLIVSGFMDVEESGVCASLGRFVDLEHLGREEEWLCAIYKSRQM